ncbi:MAG: response regulator, partial [Nitrosopumilus sp.]|nr:response regulator [Nitrosopumilus sp.]
MRGTILVVEDDVDLIEIYREILEMHQFDVKTALNGKDGVEKFTEFKPYLV